ncbi:hypothetical protein MPH_08323 [Macrophomina phaseolina MS6]|uniref:Short-chain dehydrogenase/reductase SDR n=1 Tax=Macrophomina phaseolina (strain MS6) TaxID=1126212 RepID=K2RWB4_MACPH|nr:hypothetical protein MPH_08323 [Macrophomina phaseolina MS6]
MKPELFGSMSLTMTQKAIAASLCFFGIGVVSRLSSWLSHWSLNNFVRDTSWNWPKELVIVTGGSSGIGAEIVSRLRAQKIKTIVLDVVAPDVSVTGEFLSMLLDEEELTSRRIGCGILPSCGPYVYFSHQDGRTTHQGRSWVPVCAHQQCGDSLIQKHPRRKR